MLTHGKYLIDTDVCIALIKEMPSVVEHIRKVGADECKISDITLAEMYFGAFKSGREKHFEDVREIEETFESYPIEHLRKYGELRWMLEKSGQKIGDMDMFIAATALEEDLILVTGNTDHFERIPGLRIENWMK
ncbi:MAG: PIN domain-containing protein [Bacteroidaceae bacterium]|nr:PIN domain-containing protein [Bacteroidaceae bacterium]